MSTKLGELDDFLSPGLDFTVARKPYRIDPPSAEVGLWCERLAIAAGGLREAETDEQMAAAMERVQALPQLDGDLSLAQRVLGDTYDQLAADDVDHARIKFLGQVAFVWIVSDEDAARRFWDSGGRPEALAPNRAARRASTSTAAARSTRSRGSTNGTKSPTTSSRAKAPRSRGSRS